MKLLFALAAGVVACVAAAPAFAGEAPPNPFPGPKVKIAIYVDTVTASPGESEFGVAFPAACTQMNFMRRGEGIVFRMWAVDVKTGKVLTDAEVRSAVLRVPGQANLKMRFGPHGSAEDAPWFWVTRWDVPLDYPLGVVDFTVRVKTKKGKVGVFRQPMVGPGLGKLTIVESRPDEDAPPPAARRLRT
jgi:hypothetical protein